MKVLNVIGRAFDRLIDLLWYFSGLLLALSALAIVTSIVSRQLFNFVITGVMELSSYMVLVLAMFSAPRLLRDGGHIAIDFLPLPPGAKRGMDVVTSIVGAAVFGFMSWHAAAVTGSMFEASYVTNTALRLPRGVLTAVVGVGTLLLTVQFLRNAGRALMGAGARQGAREN
ncbi:TRAP transporter small permease [Qaidamihabitans albus]|uniref:TRAP transporter small permease n=1 Tax=Qaidamihabitans albus TaxID=2795733 RepID=UPI0018F255A3|nr:TRAP transporter small permease [Qaidamihabitans albus]